MLDHVKLNAYFRRVEAVVQRQHYDIVVLGCGLVGLAAARALPKQARTLLIDRQAEPQPVAFLSPQQGGRTTALNQRSINILQHWQCSQTLAEHWGEIRSIEVSQQGYWGVSLIEAKANEPVLGAVVANDRLHAALMQSLLEHNAPEFRYATEVSQIQFMPDAVHITLSNGQPISAALLIMADGGNSPWGARCGLQWQNKNYHQVAFTLNVARNKPTSHVAEERFTDAGSRALLPLGGHWQTVVWVVDAEQAPALSTWRDTDWITAINACFGTRAGRIVQCSKASHYPLQSRQVNEQARPRLAVVGNGAITLHPIAGQGFNLHCRTVFELGRTLREATDPGAGPLLQQWQHNVQPDQQQIVSACDGLLTLFKPWEPAFAHARGLGLFAFNGLPILPQWLQRRAMGFPS